MTLRSQSFCCGHYWLRLYYLGIFTISFLLAFLLRFDLAVPPAVAGMILPALALLLPLKVVVFHYFGAHRVRIGFGCLPDLLELTRLNVVASLTFSAAALVIFRGAFPRSIYILDFGTCLMCAGALHLGAHLFGRYRKSARRGRLKTRKRVLLYGAGAAATELLAELRASPSARFEVVGLLDDAPEKWRTFLQGVEVLGPGRRAAGIVAGFRRRHRPVDEIIITAPSATAAEMRSAVANCRTTGLPFRTMPGLMELIEASMLSSQIRPVAIDDLLGRAPVNLDEPRIQESLAGKNVLVTGAGGSIGSELCRQIARFAPRRLVLFDQSESDLFRIDAELRERFRGVEVALELGTLRYPIRLEELFLRHAPDVVFHAAAYKHVPILESQVLEAAENNILGTWNLLLAARSSRARCLVMISTDKAVNPSSVMGATKRVCELLVSTLSAQGTRPGTRCVCVRFGNVLGSNGSVVPTFQRQIAVGGPVTVTHPDMMRYFMSTCEAVQLVLQASTMGGGGEIFVLDMGQPVRVVELAESLIRLSGLTPHEDIEIRYTGIRPGEKLFEEISLTSEQTLPTHHPKIRIFRDPPHKLAAIEHWVAALQDSIGRRDRIAVLDRISELVPEYERPCPPVVRVGAAAVAGLNGNGDARDRHAYQGTIQVPSN